MAMTNRFRNKERIGRERGKGEMCRNKRASIDLRFGIEHTKKYSHGYNYRKKQNPDRCSSRKGERIRIK